ncbi:MAG: ATP-NAD kinase family protein [Oceanobacter sp.]
MTMKVGLIINPYAGIGGAVGLKGSDGEAREKALNLGAELKATDRVRQALSFLSGSELAQRIQFVSAPDILGADLIESLCLEQTVIGYGFEEQSLTGSDTEALARLISEQAVDLLVFAGGDGTARDIYRAIEDSLPVLGIPAGVKIHSGVFGVTPSASGEVLKRLLEGELVDLKEAEVRDLDEEAFRRGEVRARYYGEMRVPQVGHFVQSVKQGGVEQEELVLDDIAAEVSRNLEEDCLYLIGSGKTTLAVKESLGFDGTLLGIDAVVNGECIQSDLTEKDILALLDNYPDARAILSIMGGQGHIIGRGNQQLSSTVLKRLTPDRIQLISTKTKIKSLEGRPLIVDSGDAELDKSWPGLMEVITGYEDRVLYPVGGF